MAENKASEQKKDDRVRNWTFMLYPESAPENWREILDDMHVEWCESPPHDKDLDDDGETKKAHIHVVMKFPNKTSYDTVKGITDLLHQPIPKRVRSLRTMCRYLIHLDDPAKYQYNQSDIKCHCGMDISEFFDIPKKERYECIHEMIEFIKDNCVTEFIDFMEIAYLTHPDTWYRLLCDNSAMIIQAAITSQRNKMKYGHTTAPGAGGPPPAQGATVVSDDEDPLNGEIYE